MCGIVGYIGKGDSKELLLKGLEKLEYRGYDSAGLAVLGQSGLTVFKERGRIAALREVVNPNVESSLGIGHTRWATHGEPTRINAHPHISGSGRFTLVHNGVIENYEKLKEEFLSDVEFKSDTDTEVIVHLIEFFVRTGQDPLNAFLSTMKELKGSYAIAMIDAEDESRMYVSKSKSPLLIGLGEGFNVVSSDAMAMLHTTRSFLEINDQEMAIVQRDSVALTDFNGTPVSRQPFTAELDENEIGKGTYPHYMLKEIDEQPAVIRKIIHKYQNTDGQITIDPSITKQIALSDRLYIVACGTSYHAGLIGKEYLEKMAGIPTEVHIASEFVYNPPLLSDKPMFIFISQSGETADSRAVLVEIKRLGHPTLAITNVHGSTLSRESQFTLFLHAGPEIAVASTKAYTAQVAVLSILAAATAEVLSKPRSIDVGHELSIAANAMDTLCHQKKQLEDIARSFLSTSRNCFFIGRAFDYHVCLEAALKLKEISYIQAEGFAGGELKHGTIALIEEGTPVIALSTQMSVDGSIRANVKEVAARGAHTCIFSLEETSQTSDVLILPSVHQYFTPLVSIIPLQLIAYYAALHRGCDVDKPRNLAKSVTVE